MIRLALAALMSLMLAFPAQAVQPDEVLDDPVLEARARDLSAEIRCLVCQNENIDASNAQLARDLRISGA
jgi:cytochrome c-type biogenesis protein CcmH